MRTTTLSEFQESLRATGSYRTAEDCRAKRRAHRLKFTHFAYKYDVGILAQRLH